MFYLRALDNDVNTTTPGVHKYYSAKKIERLYQPNLMDNLFVIMGYFAKKQKEYAQSKIEITKAMSGSEIHDWDLDSIVERDIRVADEILDILKQRDNEYKNIPVQQPHTQQPTAEELAKIEEFKKKGWI